jgi:hypothetical protein
MDDITQPKRAAKMKVHYGDEPPYGDPDLSSYDSDDEADSESESESDTDTEEHSKKEDAKKKKKSKDKGKGKARENNHVVTQGTRRPSRVAHRNVNYDMAVHPQDREIEGIERAEHTAKQRLGKRKSVDKADSDSDDDVDDNDNDTDNSNGYYNGYYNSYSNGYSNGYYNSYNNGYNNGNDGNISDSDTYYDSDKENRDPNAIKQKKPGNGRGDNDLKQIDTDFSDENSDASDFFNDEPSPKSASGRNPLSELLGKLNLFCELLGRCSFLGEVDGSHELSVSSGGFHCSELGCELGFSVGVCRIVHPLVLQGKHR